MRCVAVTLRLTGRRGYVCRALIIRVIIATCGRRMPRERDGVRVRGWAGGGYGEGYGRERGLVSEGGGEVVRGFHGDETVAAGGEDADAAVVAP